MPEGANTGAAPAATALRSPTPALQASHTPWRMRPKRILVGQPKMGGKCWVLDDKGVYVLEDCTGVLRTIACTHAGAGGLEAIDGVPNESGFFPDDDLREPVEPRAINFAAPLDYDAAVAVYQAALLRWSTRNGRPLYSATQAVMGSWMLDAGFLHGLTIRATGGHGATSAIASIVWLPARAAKA